MTYDDAVAAARRLDAGPLPGPDFMNLVAAVDARRRRRATRRALLAVAALMVLLIGGASAWRAANGWAAPGTASESATIQRTPMQAVFDDFTHEITERAAIEKERRPRPRLRRPKLRQPTAAPSKEPATKPERSTSADALYRTAERAMAAGDHRAARRALRTLLRKHPGYPQRGQATIDYARVEERLGRGQKAACLYKRYLAAHPTGVLASDARRSLDRLARSPAIDVANCKR